MRITASQPLTREGKPCRAAFQQASAADVAVEQRSPRFVVWKEQRWRCPPFQAAKFTFPAGIVAQRRTGVSSSC